MKKQILTIITIVLAGAVVVSLFQGIRTGLVGQKESISPQEKVEKPVKPEEPEKEGVQLPSKTQSQLKFQARAFIEQYGTYSSDSGYANLSELLDFMTDKLATVESARIEAGIEQGAGFFSIVTKVGSIDEVSFDKDFQTLFSAQVQVQEMRQGETALSQQTADVTFIKSGDKWLVDDIEFR